MNSLYMYLAVLIDLFGYARYQGRRSLLFSSLFPSFCQTFTTPTARRLAPHRQPMCYVLYKSCNKIESDKFPR